MKSVLVTGASGNVGSELIIQLARREAPVKAGVRSAGRGAVPDVASRVEFDFGNPETFQPALDGVDRVFLMRPPQM